jgi:hypothetical protein
MAIYKVDWTEEVFHRVRIEADSEEQARDIFWNSLEFGFDDNTVYGAEIQDSVVAELEVV